MSRRRCTTAHVSGVKPKKLSRALMFAWNCSKMERRERSRGNLARQRRRLAQQLAHRHFIAAGAGGNHAGAVGVRVGHGCGPVAFRGRGARRT